MEVCVSTASIIVGDDALGVPIFLTHWINRDYHNNVTPKIIWHQWYNNYALFLRTGRRGRRPLQICCRGVRVSAVYIRFSSFKQGAGSAFLCDQNLSSCSPNSRWQNVSSYTATLQDIRFGIISLYLSRKSSLLLHKKCNNCRNVAKLKDKSFVCTSLVVRICAIITQNYYRIIDENTRKK